VRVISTPLNMTLINLNPDTMYNIYCYTESFLGAAMPFVEVLNSKYIFTENIYIIIFISICDAIVFLFLGTVSYQTRCCRVLSFSTPEATMACTYNIYK